MRAFVLLLLCFAVGCRSARPAPQLPATRGLRGASVRVTAWPSDSKAVGEGNVEPARIFRQTFTADLTAAGVAVVDTGGQLDLAFDYLGLDNNTWRASGTVTQAGVGEVQRLAVDDSVECFSWWADVRSGDTERCFARHLAIQFLESPQVAQAVQGTQPPGAAPSRPPLAGKLAVLQLRNFVPEFTPQNAQYFTDLVRSAALKSQPQLQVITRENLLVLLQASGKDLTDCEGECEVDTGRRIGADQIVSGEIQRLGTLYKISLRLHETHEGRLLSSTQASGKTIEELDSSAQKAAGDLLEGR